jgi:hypothetical protein
MLDFSRKDTMEQRASNNANDILMKAVRNDCRELWDLRQQSPEEYDELLVSLAVTERCSDSLIKSNCVAAQIFDIISCKRDRDEIIKEIESNYKAALHDSFEIKSVLEDKFRLAWHDHLNTTPKLRVLHDDVRDLVDDDNRDRARSLRGI